jgi:hypothetical protein
VLDDVNKNVASPAITTQKAVNKDRYVIYSASETLADAYNTALYWSNEYGWGSLSTATVLTFQDTLENNMPMSADHDAEYVLLPQLEDEHNG